MLPCVRLTLFPISGFYILNSSEYDLEIILRCHIHLEFLCFVSYQVTLEVTKDLGINHL